MVAVRSEKTTTRPAAGIPPARGQHPVRNRSLCVAGEEQAAVGGRRRLAAGGVVGQDGHHVAADGAEFVAVVDPAGAVQLAQPSSAQATWCRA